MAWVFYIFVLFICGVLVYTVIPDLFLHRLGISCWKRQYTSGVALTFDDGPDPVLTPKVLDVLARNKVRATFFLVGAKVAECPELSKEILAQGHQIGLHSQKHRYAWLLSPWATWREWEEGAATLEKYTGQQIELVRPPWGTFNLVTWWWMKRHHKRIVLWNIEGHDWQVKRKPEQISQRIIKKAKAGGIIVLHDSGGETGATEHTLQALEIICQRLVMEKKLPVVPLQLPDWNIWKRMVFSLWQEWENAFAHFYHIERIDSKNLFRLSKIDYKGPKLYSADGRILAKKGDRVVELHLDSLRLSGKGTDTQIIGIKVLRQTRESLPDLAAYINDNPDYMGIQVFMGVSLLNRGVKGLGFHIQEVSSTWVNRGVGVLQKLNLRIYHPVGKSASYKILQGQPKIVWISREELLSRWLNRDRLSENNCNN